MERERVESGMRKIEYCPISMKKHMVNMKDHRERMADRGCVRVL